MTNTSFMLSRSTVERFEESSFITLRGMFTIFLVALSLLLVIEILHIVFHWRLGRKGKTSKSSQISLKKPNANDAALAAAIAAAIAANEDEGAIVAAITAAISAMRAEEGECGEFRVVSFKRVTSGRRRF